MPRFKCPWLLPPEAWHTLASWVRIQPIVQNSSFLCSTENTWLCQQHFLTHGTSWLRRHLNIRPLNTDFTKIFQIRNFKAQYINEFLWSSETACWSEKRSIREPSLQFKVKIDAIWLSNAIMLIYWELYKGLQRVGMTQLQV